MEIQIKKLFLKEDIQELPSDDELHVSGIFTDNEIVALHDVRVTRDVTGAIYCAGNIIVCKDVMVIGSIHCKKCTLEGHLNGNVSASDMLEIKASAVLNGNIITRNLNISPAAVLNGYVNVVSIKEGKQVDLAIKLIIDNVKEPGKHKKAPVPEIQPKDDPVIDIPVKLASNIRVSTADVEPPKEQHTTIEVNNDKWW